MLQIRSNVFETNSSSTHSICIVPKEKFKLWEDGKLYYDRWDDVFLTEEEVRARIDEIKDKYYKDSDDADEYEIRTEEIGALSFKEFSWNSDGLAYYEKEYTTLSGDEIVAFGIYGNDW